MKAEHIKKLINKYYEGQTSLEEEEQLRTFFSKEENREIDLDFAGMVHLMGQFENFSEEEEIEIPTPEMKSETKIVQFPWYYSVAASVIFLLVGWIAGNQFTDDQVDNSTIAELKQEISEMKNMMSYQHLTSMSASEKIKVTYEVRELDSLDIESMNTMIDLMRFDENANVRLSATDALVQFGKNEKIRSSFVSALKDEPNPMVKIKLIDAIIKLNQKNAIPELQKIITSDDENQAVKQTAAYGLSKLI